MALRNQPYIPLYVQDFMTDEKLIECSAASTGVYIRIMCILHKQDSYGKLLLKQKYKQTDKQIKNFASQLATSLPYTFAEIESALSELLTEKVLRIEDDFLLQKRMVRDNEISEKRALAGSSGGKKTTKKFAQANSEAKPQANYESEIEDESESEFIDESRKGGMGEKQISPLEKIQLIWVDAGLIHTGSETAELRQIAEKILNVKDIGRITPENEIELETVFKKIIQYLKQDNNVKFYGSFKSLNNNLDKVLNAIKNGKSKGKQDRVYLKEDFQS